MFRFTPLASGSKGNCILLETDGKKLLIDCGLTLKQLTERLALCETDPKEIDAILITHEHSDHIRGLETFCDRYDTQVFANIDTAKAVVDLGMRDIPFKIFTTGEAFSYASCEFTPFSIQHDTLDPVAFTITQGSFKAGVCTDLGFVTSVVRSHLQKCNLLYVESNHEPNMVHACNRPKVYKTRVLGRQGHLSNDECCQLLDELKTADLEMVYLAHLSEECNNPEVAQEKACATIDAQILIAKQHERTAAFAR